MTSRKMKSTSLLILLIGLVLIFVPVVTGNSWQSLMALWLEDYQEAAEEAASYGDDDDDDEAEEERAALQPLTVILDDAAVDYAGVETVTMKQGLYYPETSAFASVVDIRELIQWRSRLNQLQSALTLAQVNEQSSRQELDRLKKLANSTGSVASKNVSYAQVTWQEAVANLKAARFQLEDAETELSQSWGQVIAGWVLKKDGQEFARLVSREDSLLLISLPVEDTLPADVNVIRVSRLGQRESARKAYYVSPAYNPNQISQGETYYFRITSGKLRTGMRLDAWIPQNDEPLQGFHIPEAAIVWYSGQPWTYVQQDEATYKRRALASGQILNDGLFMQEGFEVGELLVVAGSQMLLSEEFRWQIMDEDDD